MFLSDKTMKLLVQSGLAADKLVEILQSLRADEEAARPVKTKAAERTARWRAGKQDASQPSPRDATVTVGDIGDAGDVSGRPLPPSPQAPQPPTPTRECVTTREANAREEAAFGRFWLAYPRKTAKADARKAFAKAWRKLPPLEAEARLSGGLERAKAAWTDAQFIPHAATWLNGDRWEDEPEPATPRKAHDRSDPNQRQSSPREDGLRNHHAGAMAALNRRLGSVG